MKKSKRGNVDPFIVMDVMENARKAEERGKDIVHMEVGQPGTPAPIDAQKELIKIMRSNLKKTSFQVWRERVYGRKAKHDKK